VYEGPNSRPAAPELPWFGLFELVVLGLATLWTFFTVLGSPVRGLANQGDYERLTIPLGIAPAPSMPYDPYNLTTKFLTGATPAQLGVPTSIWTNPTLRNFYFGYHSSETVLIRIALFLHGVFAGGSLFDIRWLGFVNATVLLAALASLIAASRQLPRRARAITVVLLAVALSDPGYVLYSNSFYSEPAELYFFLLAFGLAACALIASRPLLPFAGFVLAGVMAASAKTEDAVLSIPLVLLGLLIANRVCRGWHWYAGYAGSFGIGASGYWSWTDQVPYIHQFNLYDSVFYGVLWRNHSIDATLGALGLPTSLAKYAGTTADSPHNGFGAPGIAAQFFDRMSSGKLIGYYLSHPSSLLKITGQVARTGLPIRPQLGNLSYGQTPAAIYLPNSPWTVVHRSVLPHSLLFIAFVLLAGIVVSVVVRLAATSLRPEGSENHGGSADMPPAAGAGRFRPDGRLARTGARWRTWSARIGATRTTPEVLLAVAVTAALALVQVPVGDGLNGVVKHEVTFDIMFDIVLIPLVALAVHWFIARREAAFASGAERSGPPPWRRR
jgi:hypothetical protein